MTELEYLQLKIKELEKSRVEELVAGCAVDDHLKYVKIVGVIEGLALAHSEIKDLLKNRDEMEEIDE